MLFSTALNRVCDFGYVYMNLLSLDTSCEDKLTCRDCLTLPSCGWKENAMRDGSGQCLKGGAQGPKDSSNYKYWHFFDCPCEY